MRWLLAIGAALVIFRPWNPLMAFAIKSGVFGTLNNVMFPALQAVQDVWELHGLQRPTITSIEDGQHRPNSLHYRGLAFDIRLNDVPPQMHEAIRREVQQLAGPAYDVIHEYHATDRDHLHVEFDPK